MSNQFTVQASNEPVAANSIISLSHLVPKTHKLYHLFNFIGLNYGNSPENILKAFITMLDFDKGLRTLLDSKKKLSLKNVVSLLRYTLPASLYGIELGIKIKKYIDFVRKGELSEFEKR